MVNKAPSTGPLDANCGSLPCNDGRRQTGHDEERDRLLRRAPPALQRLADQPEFRIKTTERSAGADSNQNRSCSGLEFGNRGRGAALQDDGALAPGNIERGREG